MSINERIRRKGEDRKKGSIYPRLDMKYGKRKKLEESIFLSIIINQISELLVRFEMKKKEAHSFQPLTSLEQLQVVLLKLALKINLNI